MKKEIVYRFVTQIPKGKVASYKYIARLASFKNPRTVGPILHNNPDPQNIPCHRVVHADGSLPDDFAFGGKYVQKELLEKEGVKFKNGGKIGKEFFVVIMPS